MTTELTKLQIENPPKEKKNDRGEHIHGDGLAKLAGPEEVKGAGHAASGAMDVKDKGKEAGDGDGPDVHAGEAGQGVGGRERGKSEAQELFAGEDCAAQGQRSLLEMPIYAVRLQLEL